MNRRSLWQNTAPSSTSFLYIDDDQVTCHSQVKYQADTDVEGDELEVADDHCEYFLFEEQFIVKERDFAFNDNVDMHCLRQDSDDEFDVIIVL